MPLEGERELKGGGQVRAAKMVKPFPVFSLARGDMHITMLGAVFCCSIAIILRSSQDTPIDGKNMWKDTVIVFSALFGLIFAGITMAKAWFGYGEMCGESDQGYDSLESGDGIPFVQTAASLKQSGTDEHEKSMSARVASSRRNDSAMHSARAESTKSYRDDDDIVCGIDLEVTKAQFESHSVKHPAGTFRIVGLHRDGVCERQGACVVGDVLATVDGKKVSGMRLEQVGKNHPHKSLFSPVTRGLFAGWECHAIHRTW